MSRGFKFCEYAKTISSAKLPTRSTQGSAGYDFYCLEDVTIPSHLNMFLNSDNNMFNVVKPFCIKTGIKAFMEKDEVLQIYIRSSSPSKLGLILANSVGIIDSDYYDNVDNEGEIGFLVYNLTPYAINLKQGDKIGQGIFTKYLTIWDDNANNIRMGGFGSTDN